MTIDEIKKRQKEMLPVYVGVTQFEMFQVIGDFGVGIRRESGKHCGFAVLQQLAIPYWLAEIILSTEPMVAVPAKFITDDDVIGWKEYFEQLKQEVSNGTENVR